MPISGKVRRAVVWLCLVSTIGFAALDAVHHDPINRPGRPSAPCRICQVSHTAVPVPRADVGQPRTQFIEPVVCRIEEGFKLNLTRRSPFIRPPPALL